MRVMVKSDCPKCKLKVTQVFVLVNGWEYFLEKPTKKGIAFGLVCGFEDELGSVYLPEIIPYIVGGATKNLSNALPAPGWEWK